jgi:hypothetical protein
MIRDLVRVAGEEEVHASDAPRKSVCKQEPFEKNTAAWQGDTSEITCQECQRLVSLDPKAFEGLESDPRDVRPT